MMPARLPLQDFAFDAGDRFNYEYNFVVTGVSTSASNWSHLNHRDSQHRSALTAEPMRYWFVAAGIQNTAGTLLKIIVNQQAEYNTQAHRARS